MYVSNHGKTDFDPILGDTGVTRKAPAGCLFLLYDLVAVEPDGEGALVFDRDSHVRAKNTGGDFFDVRAAGLDDVLVEFVGQIRRAGIDE